MIISSLLVLFLLLRCKKIDPERVVKVITGSVTDISYNSCSVDGTILDISKNGIDQYGFCWAVTENPTIENDKTQLGSKNSTGSFSDNITGLSINTTYYTKAYAINTQGTAYGSQISFTTNTDGQSGTVTDIDGNIYNTVTIGTQVWMTENLKTTKYCDGTVIQLVTDNKAWSNLTTYGYCWFNNNKDTYKATYGALYNGYVTDAASNGGKNVCPTGWHVPSDAEWTILTDYLGGESVAGLKLKETGSTHWSSLDTRANNKTGFTALPGGYRINNGLFSGLGDYCYLWSSTKSSTMNVWYRLMVYNYIIVYRYSSIKLSGFSVRCLQD